jgi:hypothetical protein
MVISIPSSSASIGKGRQGRQEHVQEAADREYVRWEAVRVASASVHDLGSNVVGSPAQGEVFFIRQDPRSQAEIGNFQATVFPQQEVGQLQVPSMRKQTDER